MADATVMSTRHDFEARIVKRCWEDDEFRKEFVDDPAGTFAKYLEVPAASLPKIVVHEEAPGAWHIVLPQQPGDAGQLSEEDLEKVAGGMTPIVPLVIASVVASVMSAGSVSASVSASVTVKRGW